MVKPRFRYPAEHTEAERDSARATLWEAWRALLGLFAPFAPFITEHLYQRLYRPYEGAVSLHLTPWPAVEPGWRAGDQAGEDGPGRDQLARVGELVTILDQVRALRTRLRWGAEARPSALVLQASGEAAEKLVAVTAEPLRAAARAEQVVIGEAGHDSGVPGVRFDLIA